MVISKPQRQATIVIYRTNHYVVLVSMIRCLEALGWNCTLVGSSESTGFARDLLEAKNCSCKIVGVEGSLQDRFQKYQRLSAESDLIIYDEHNEETWEFARYPPQCPSIYWVFNLRSWYTTRTWKQPRNWRLNRSAKKILRSFDSQITETESQVAWAKTTAGPNTQIKSFLGAIFDPINDTTKTDEDEGTLKLTVPGTVLKNRRDYETVLRAFETAFSEEWERAELCLLGPIIPDWNPDIVNIISKLEDSGAKVSYYEGSVSLSEYTRVLNATDLIIAPIRLGPDYGLNPFTRPEVQGHTKSTGSLLDQVCHGKPALYPETYHLEPELESSTRRFRDSEELSSIFRRCVDTPEFLHDLKKSALQVSANYTLEKQSKRLAAIIETVL